MNGNGFKFGSKVIQKVASVKGNVNYCITFGQKSKVSIKITCGQCTVYITNCASLNNNIKYKLPYTFASWINKRSWNKILSIQTKTIT